LPGTRIGQADSVGGVVIEQAGWRWGGEETGNIGNILSEEVNPNYNDTTQAKYDCTNSEANPQAFTGALGRGRNWKYREYFVRRSKPQLQ
jgi:hypothetical protein